MESSSDQMPYEQLLCLRAVAGLLRTQQSASGAEIVQAVRRLARDEGVPRTDQPDKQRVRELVHQLRAMGLLQLADGKWQLTSAGVELIDEMADEHTDDVSSAQSFLDAV